MDTITVVNVDDHPLVAQALWSLVEKKPNIQLVATGSVGDDVIKLVSKHRPNVLILDLSMPQHANGNGTLQKFQALPTILQLTQEYPETKIIVLSGYNEPALVQGSMTRGVVGYILKQDELSLSLANAIQTVTSGGAYFSETIVQEMFNGGIENGVNLTHRQIEILSAISRAPDDPYPQVAATLNITESTFKSHLTKAFKSLGVSNVTAALMRCLQLGIINPMV